MLCEFAAYQRARQIERETRRRSRGIGVRDPRSAGALGREHRRICAPNESVCRLVLVAGDGHADAGSGRDVLLTDHERLGRGEQDALGDVVDGRVVGQVFADRDELVAAEASEGVGLAHGLTERGRHRREEHVTGAVLPRVVVVDPLEIVEVDEEHREAGAGSVAARDCALEAVEEQPPIG